MCRSPWAWCRLGAKDPSCPGNGLCVPWLRLWTLTRHTGPVSGHPGLGPSAETRVFLPCGKNPIAQLMPTQEDACLPAVTPTLPLGSVGICVQNTSVFLACMFPGHKSLFTYLLVSRIPLCDVGLG